MKKIGEGRTAEVYIKDDKAIKLFYDWYKQPYIDKEENISNIAATLCDLAPKCFGQVTINKRTGLVLEYISGKLLKDQFSSNIFSIKKMIIIMGQSHRKITSKNSNELPSFESKYLKLITNSERITDSDKSIIIRFLKDQINNQICHGDYHPENIIIDEKQQFRVIDWTNAFAGNHLFDVARSYYLITNGVSVIKQPVYIRIATFYIRLFAGKWYLKGYFNKEKIPSDFKKWVFIVKLLRWYEGIVEEEKLLNKVVSRTNIKKLFTR